MCRELLPAIMILEVPSIDWGCTPIHTHTHTRYWILLTSFVEINRGCVYIYIYGKNVSFHFSARCSTTWSFSIYGSRRALHFVICLQRDEREAGKDILQFVVLDRIYTYICIHVCIPCLFEYLFRISGNSLLRTSLLIDQMKRDLSNRGGAATLISYRRYEKKSWITWMIGK